MSDALMGVSLEAILADLGLEEPLEGYLSTREWAERLGVSVGRMQGILAAAKREGKLSAAHQMREAIDGNQRPVPVYRLMVGGGE